MFYHLDFIDSVRLLMPAIRRDCGGGSFAGARVTGARKHKKLKHTLGSVHYQGKNRCNKTTHLFDFFLKFT